ncbi:hypothetical protein K1719_031677 [Acacia pycnantha]|nr:hypothetical protein K1719_031677 [Acacia pycnantha]
MIGKALKVDVNTLAQCNNQNMMVERGKFARVSVKVDLNQALKSRFVIRSTIYTVEYEGLDLICFKCGKYGHSQEKCPLVCNTGDDSPEITQPVVTTSHASKSPSCAQLKPLVSVPGVNSDEEFGSWMIAKRISRKRIHIVEPERKVGKMPENNKSNGKGKKSASGSRFDVLQDVEDRSYSKGVDRLRKTEVATTTWRRKEDPSESGTKEDVVQKDSLNLDTNGKCPLLIGEPHFESSIERELKEKVVEVKEKEHKTTNVLVDQPVILKQVTDDYNLRPNGLSSVRNKKKAARAHNVIFGSTKTNESSKVSESKEQAGGKKKNYKEKETVQCNPDIVEYSTTTRPTKNDVVDRGEEDSDVVQSSLPHNKLLEHITDDAKSSEGQESLVAETQFELRQEPDGGNAR